MKFAPATALFLNLCFRIFLLIYLLKENSPAKIGKKSVKQWVDPVAKRVFFISINGLNSEFFHENSTPFIREMVSNYGFRGIVTSEYFETNEGGMSTMLTGRSGHSSPIFWSRPSCLNTLLSSVRCKCVMGRNITSVPLECFHPEEKPLENYFKFSSLFNLSNRHSCLYIINFDIDPVLMDNYKLKLSNIDENIRLLANTVDSVWTDNKTAYIITSARGSPVGDSMTIESPIVAWGVGIAYSTDVWVIRRNQIAAILCVLLAANFPTGLVGTVPLSVVDLSEYEIFEWALYTVKHYESVLEAVDVADFYLKSSNLESAQLYTRLEQILKKIKRKASARWYSLYAWFILSHTVWGAYLASVFAVGYGQINFNLKNLFALVVALGGLLSCFPSEWQLKIPLALLLWLTYHNRQHILDVCARNGKKCLRTFALLVIVIFFVGNVGNSVAIPILFAPVILWPILKGFFHRLNTIIMINRMMSGLTLCILLFSRLFGETPDSFVVSLASLTFLVYFYMLLLFFHKSMDFHMKFLYFIVIITTIHIGLLYQNKASSVSSAISVILFLSFLVSISLVSGTLIERLLKIYLSLLIPVQMFSIRMEIIYYFALTVQMFTWVFIEYHGKSSSIFNFSPGIFSIEPRLQPCSAPFSPRKILFFLLYVYVSYFAVGHVPELHSYDFYVLPKYIFRYPEIVSCFLAAIKFFIPFFVPTISYMALTNLLEKDEGFQLATILWAADVVGCILVVCFGFANKIFMVTAFPGKFSYVVLQQCGCICIIFSYFVGSNLLFSTNSGLICRLKKEKNGEETTVKQ